MYRVVGCPHDRFLIGLPHLDGICHDHNSFSSNKNSIFAFLFSQVILLGTPDMYPIHGYTQWPVYQVHVQYVQFISQSLPQPSMKKAQHMYICDSKYYISSWISLRIIRAGGSEATLSLYTVCVVGICTRKDLSTLCV